MLAKATTVDVGVPQRGVEIKTRLLDLGRQASDMILSAGLLLREYKSGAYWKDEGHQTFDEAIESWKSQGLVDYGARQARHLIAVVDMVDGLNIAPDEVKKLGIGRLREIASLKDTKEQLALLGEAEQLSVADVQKRAKAIRDKAAGRDTDPLDAWTFMFSETQKTFVKECLERARLIAGADQDKVSDATVLVDVILADWLSGAPEPEAVMEKE